MVANCEAVSGTYSSMDGGGRQTYEPGKAPKIEDSVYQFRQLKANRKDIRLLRYCGLRSYLLNFQLVQFEYDKRGQLARTLSANKMRPNPQFAEFDELARPPYIALSYEWGNQNDRHNIAVDDIEVSITSNLFNALRRLTRLPHLESTERIRWIWVDALCIRQDVKNDVKSGVRELDEKHSLIPKMDEIYRQADAVYAWVGPKSNYSHTAMQVIQDFANRKAGTRLTTCTLWPKPCDQYCWEHMLDFAGRSFWRRLWIVQEITLARKVMVVCGDQVANFNGIQRMLKTIGGRSSNDLRFLRMLHECRLDRWEHKKQLKLLKALWLTRRSVTQSPTDRVYALLAMSTDWEDFLDAPKSQMSEIELNLHMTHRWLQRQYSLDIILLAPARTVLREYLPSWCPDFLNLSSDAGGNAAQGSLIDYLAFEDQINRVSISPEWWEAFELRRLGSSVNLWQTTARSQLSDRALRRTSTHSLEVKGVFVDQVETSSVESSWRTMPSLEYLIDALCLYDPSFSFENRQHCALFIIIMFWVCPCCKYSDLLNRMTSCATVNDWLKNNRYFKFQGFAIESIVENSHWTYLSEMRSLSWLPDPRRFSGTEIPLHNLQEWYFEHKLKENTQAFTNSFLAFRKLILEGLEITESKYGGIGWAPERARSSDEVYLLKGCSFPVVLRPKTYNNGQICHNVVGRAYLPHLMTGAIWENVKQHLYTIVLR